MLLPTRSHFVGFNNVMTFNKSREAVICLLVDKQGLKGKNLEGKYIQKNKDVVDAINSDETISKRQLLKRSLQNTFLGRPAPTYHSKTRTMREKQPTFSDIYGITAPSHGKLLYVKDKFPSTHNAPSKVVLMCYQSYYILTTTGYLTVPGAIDKILAELESLEVTDQLESKDGYGHNYDSYTDSNFKPHAIVFTKPSSAMAMFHLATKGFTTEYSTGTGILCTKQNVSKIDLTKAPDKG